MKADMLAKTALRSQIRFTL